MAMERKLELLSPAGDWERLEMAVAYGADAVYLAGDTFGMRSFAGNFSPEELRRAADLCRRRGVALHVTCNTMPRNQEVDRLPQWLAWLEGCGVTAVILADGSLWTWGRNDTQQLGLDQTAPTVSLPAQVPAVTQAAAVGTGTYQTVCLLSDDTLFSWGPHAMGLLGGGAVETLAEVPKAEAAAPAEATQVTFQEETAAWVPLAILAGSAILLVLAGCLSRKERVGV